MARVLLACFGLFYAGAAGAQTDPLVASRAEYREAVTAYEAHDYTAFLEHSKRAQELRPSHGGVIYALASAYALSGDDARALQMLRRFASLGYFADIAADSDLTALRKAPGYAEVRRHLQANRGPVVRSTVAFTLPEKDLLSEGIAYDPRRKAFLVGSVHHRKIVRVDSAGHAADWVSQARDGLWAPLGMKVDATGDVLWVAAAALPQMAGFSPGELGRSGLFRFDLATGKLTGRFLIRDGASHVLGDLTIAGNGDVYASDSRAPIVWRLRAGGDSIDRFLESPLLTSAQGLALTPDERALYLADYSRGILKIDLASKHIAVVPCGARVLALGIDGLYIVRGKLVGVQNGVEPHRVVRLTLDSHGDSLVGMEVLERLHPKYSEPTLGVVVGDIFYYVANSQWERFGETGAIARPEDLEAPAILRLRL